MAYPGGYWRTAKERRYEANEQTAHDVLFDCEEDGEPTPSPLDPEQVTYLNVSALRIAQHSPEPTEDDDDPLSPYADRVLALCHPAGLKEIPDPRPGRGRHVRHLPAG